MRAWGLSCDGGYVMGHMRRKGHHDGTLLHVDIRDG
jgi:hypothetical protein